MTRTTGAAKQAERGDDNGRQDDTTTSNEIGKTSTTPRPPHRKRSRRPQTSHIPPPQGAGDARADKDKHDDPPTPSAQHGKPPPDAIHPMTREAENAHDYERTPRAVFPSSQHKHARISIMTPQPKEGGKQGKRARTRRRGEPRKGNRHHRRKCPSEATECDLRAYI